MAIEVEARFKGKSKKEYKNKLTLAFGWIV